MFQIISQAEVAGLQDGDGQDGSIGVLYQDRTNGGVYIWNPETAALEFLPALSSTGSLTAADGSVYALSETTPYVNATASAGATVFTGACELAGWYCSVAAGNITIYDALSATGTPIVPATALAVGPMPIFGAGTTGKLALTTGCHVVLSGAATVRVLVA